jgi:hypothetical protein
MFAKRIQSLGLGTETAIKELDSLEESILGLL